MTKVLWILLIIGFILLGVFYYKQDVKHLAPDQINTPIMAKTDVPERTII